MANVLITLALVVITAGTNASMAGAQSLPPPISSSSSCSASLVSLASCLTLLQAGPNNSSPTQGCCTSLASVVSTSAACFCQLFTTTNNPLGIPVNQTQALALPGACKITIPPLNQCKSPAGLSSSPAAAPSSPTPVVNNPTSTAKSPATSAALPPTMTTTGGGALSPSGRHEDPTASANAGTMMDVSMLNHVVGIMVSLTYLISSNNI